MQQLRSKKKWVEDYKAAETLVGDLEVLFEFYKEGDATSEEISNQFHDTRSHIENLEFKNMLSEEGDRMSAVLQITAGAGGTESCDWAAMLMRMYLMWAQNQGYQVRELNYQEGDVAGIKNCHFLKLMENLLLDILKGKMGFIDWCVSHHLTVMLNATLLLFPYMYIRLRMTPLK